VQAQIFNVDAGVYTVNVQLFDQSGSLILQTPSSQPVPVADPGPLDPQAQPPTVRVVMQGPGGRKQQ
jgi:hypothetical protein